MSFSDDIEKALVGAARDGARDLMLENARAARSEMGSDGIGITFEWRAAHGGSIESLGSLNVKGPSDGVVERFHQKLRKRMGQ